MSQKQEKAVDFNDPTSIEEALANAEAATPAVTVAEKKPAKPKTIKVQFTATEDIAAGTTVEFDFEIPKGTSSRGELSGVSLDEMTDEQLKIEYRNANSVYYKQSKKPGTDTTKSKTRLEAVKAAMAAKGIQPSSRGAVAITASSVAELVKNGSITIEQINAILNGETLPEATPAE